MSDIQQKIHDIRRPLNSISMQAELVKMLTTGAENSSQLQAAANKIIENAKQCSEQLQSFFEEFEATRGNESFADKK